VEEGTVLSNEESRDLLYYVLEYLLRLQRDLHPSFVPSIRPRSREAFSFALEITNVQIGFLLLHEFGHLAFDRNRDTLRSEEEYWCDSFAYERSRALASSDRTWFLSIRWLFETLAFDRVLAECLDRSDWAKVDWYQIGLRSRRRLEETFTQPSDAERYLSPYENVGTLLLLDLKSQLHKLGPDGLAAFVEHQMEFGKMPSAEWANQRITDIADRVFSGGPI